MTDDELKAEATALILEAARRAGDPNATAVAVDLVERFDLAADADERRAIWTEAEAAMRVWLRRH